MMVLSLMIDGVSILSCCCACVGLLACWQVAATCVVVVACVVSGAMDVNLVLFAVSMVGLLVWCISAGTWVNPSQPMPWILSTNTAISLGLVVCYSLSAFVLQHYLGVYQGRMDNFVLEPDA